MVRSNTYVTYDTYAYFEVTIDVATEHFTVGFCNDECPVDISHGLGFIPVGLGSMGYRPTSTYEPGLIWYNGYAVAGGLINGVAGDVIGVGIHKSAYPYFTSTSMQADGDNWNNNSGADPLHSVGNVGQVIPGNIHAAFSCSDIGAQATFNFGDTPFHFTPPVGFPPWNSVATVAPKAPLASITVPTGLTAGVYTTTSCVLKWNAVPGALSYNVRWLDPDGAVKWILPYTNTTNTTYTATFTAGVPDLFLVFEVQTVTAAGVSHWSNPCAFFVEGTDGNLNSATPFYVCLSLTSTSITYAMQPYETLFLIAFLVQVRFRFNFSFGR